MSRRGEKTLSNSPRGTGPNVEGGRVVRVLAVRSHNNERWGFDQDVRSRKSRERRGEVLAAKALGAQDGREGI